MSAVTGLPLRDLRVADFTHAAAGPFATMYLADLGAEVVKIERPGRGDGARYMGTPALGRDRSDYFVGLNRNKKSVLIDLKKPDGVALARDLIAGCDVVVENFRPGVLAGLGLGFDDCAPLRTGLVYCSISGFGPDGPWRDRPANDIVMQAVSGLMAITGTEDGGPVRIGAPVSDYATGLFALSGILAAVHARADHPDGQHVHVPMLDASLALLSNYAAGVLDFGRPVPRMGSAHAQLVPYQAFRCADGEYVLVGAFTDAFWRRLCGVLDRADLAADERYAANVGRVAHRGELIAALEPAFETRPATDWEERLAAADIPCSRIVGPAEALRSPQALANDVVAEVSDADGRRAHVVRCPISSTGWPPAPAQGVPAMGTDTAEVLGTLLGLDRARLHELHEDGVIDDVSFRREAMSDVL